MKILHVVYSKKRGGVEKAYYDYSIALASITRNAKNILLLMPKNFQYENELRHMGFTVKFLSRFGFYVNLPVIMFHAMLFKPQLIVGHSSKIARKLRALTLFKGWRRKIVVVNHGGHSRWYRGFDNVVCVNKKLLSEVGNAKNKFLVHNTFDAVGCENITSAVQKKIAQDVCAKAKAGKLTLGFMARLNTDKGGQFLPKIMQMCLQAKVACKMVVAGDGPLLAKIKQEAKKLGVLDKMHFVGWLDLSKKQEFYKTFDVLLVPSVFESFGIVCLEGIAHSKPVIAFANDGFEEIDKCKEYLTIVENCNYQAMANAVQTLAVTPQEELLARLSTRPQILSKFTQATLEHTLKGVMKKVGCFANSKDRA